MPFCLPILRFRFFSFADAKKSLMLSKKRRVRLRPVCNFFEKEGDSGIKSQTNFVSFLLKFSSILCVDSFRILLSKLALGEWFFERRFLINLIFFGASKLYFFVKIGTCAFFAVNFVRFSWVFAKVWQFCTTYNK